MRTIEARVYSHGWAYRFGGDEYLLLLPNMDLKVAGEFLQSLQERLGSLEFQGIHERIAVSIGLCLVTPDSFLTDREVQEKAKIGRASCRERVEISVVAEGDNKIESDES